MTDYLTRLAQRTLGLLPVAEPLISPSFTTSPKKIKYRPEISFNENISFAENSSLEISKVTPKKPGQKNTSLEPEERLLSKNADIFDLKTISEPVRIEMQRNTDDTEKNIVSNNIVSKSIQEKQDADDLFKDGYNRLANGGSGRRFPEQIRIVHETQMQGANPISEFNVDNIAGISSGAQRRESPAVNDRRISSEMSVHDSHSFENQQKREKTLVRFEKQILETSDQGTYPDLSTLRNREKETAEKIRKPGFENPISPVITRTREPKNPITNDIHTRAQQPPIPTVKVTIGRVEVRAVTLPNVQRPIPARKNPALSLDEYLKQHNG